MKPGIGFAVCLMLASLCVSACSFDYGSELADDTSIPEMTMTGVNASRYENARLSVELRASILEMYDADKIWTASDVEFVQYTNTGDGAIEAEGSAGLFLVDDAADVYSLGQTASFRIVEDNLFLTASDLRWDRSVHTLVSGLASSVELERSDGSVIVGTGFSANTLSREYQFTGSVAGKLVSGGASSSDLPETGL